MNFEILKNINFSSIIGNFNKTLNIFNKAIPVYKQVRPIIGNAKNAINVLSTSKEAKKQIINETIKENTRPINTEKDMKHELISLDTLTFFQ